MKKILFFFALLISFSVNAQVKVCQLPQTTTGTPNDYIIKEDSTCVGTRKIKISDFITTYGLGGGTSVDTTSLSNRIDAKVDTIYKNATRDSIVYTINSRRHAILDSVGSTTSTTVPIEITLSAAQALEAGPTYPIEGQSYIINTVGITGVTQILTRGVRDATTGNVIFDVNCQAYLDDGASIIVGYFPCTYVVSTGKISVSTKIAALVSQERTDPPTLAYLKNDLGLTFTPSYNTVGDYQLDISGLGIFNSIYVEQGSSTTTGSGIDYFYAYWNGASIVIECYRNTIASITRRDELLLNAPITLNAILTN